MAVPVVDAHEDLAWNMLTFDRDYLRAAEETRRREQDTLTPQRNGHTLLGWPDWVRGNVVVVFATLFASPARAREGPWDTQCYNDETQAHALYRRQLELYQRWTADHADQLRLIIDRKGLEDVLATWEGSPPPNPRVGLVLSMEGADGVRSPDELEEWYAGGLRLLGPAWRGTRYAGGTGEPGPLSEAGRSLLRAMAELGMVLDLSHLADEAAHEAIDRYPGALIASHSNPRALHPASASADRHLSDQVIRGIVERDGVIGIVLWNSFLKGEWTPGDGREAVTLADVAVHIDYVCQIAGDARHVGLGSDFDGGFGLDQVPSGMDSVADLRFLGESLAARGYSQPDIEAVLGGNWLHLLRRALPRG